MEIFCKKHLKEHFFLRALKSFCTQEIHRFKEQKSFSTSAPVFMGNLVSVETKGGLAFTFSSLLPTFLLFPKGRDNPV